MRTPDIGLYIGDTVKDKVSGHTGIVTAIKEILFGNIQCVVEGKAKEGGESLSLVIDYQQLEPVERKTVSCLPCERTTEIELGDEVKDRISGYTGICTIIWYWMNGCVQATVEVQKNGKDVEGAVREAEQRFVVVTKGKIKLKPLELEKKKKNRGGPSHRMPSRSV